MSGIIWMKQQNLNENFKIVENFWPRWVIANSVVEVAKCVPGKYLIRMRNSVSLFLHTRKSHSNCFSFIKMKPFQPKYLLIA